MKVVGGFSLRLAVEPLLQSSTECLSRMHSGTQYKITHLAILLDEPGHVLSVDWLSLLAIGRSVLHLLPLMAKVGKFLPDPRSLPFRLIID